MTITAFADLPRGIQQALFRSVLSEDTVKRMNILGLQEVNAPVQPTPCIRVDGELLSQTSNPEAILSPPDDDLLTNLKWMQDPVDKLQLQVTVIEASLQLPVVQSSDEVDLSSLVRDYEEVFDETVLPAMSGESFKINLKANATPYAQLKARKIPIPYMEQLKRQLHDMEKLNFKSNFTT